MLAPDNNLTVFFLSVNFYNTHIRWMFLTIDHANLNRDVTHYSSQKVRTQCLNKSYVCSVHVLTHVCIESPFRCEDVHDGLYIGRCSVV